MTYMKLYSLKAIIILCSNAAYAAQEDIRVKQLAAIGAEEAPQALDKSYLARGSVKMPAGIQVPAQRAVTLLIPYDGASLLVEFRANNGTGTLTGHIIGSIDGVNDSSIKPAEGYLCQDGRLPVVNGEWISNVQMALDQTAQYNLDHIVPQVRVDSGLSLNVFLKSN